MERISAIKISTYLIKICLLCIEYNHCFIDCFILLTWHCSFTQTNQTGERGVIEKYTEEIVNQKSTWHWFINLHLYDMKQHGILLSTRLISKDSYYWWCYRQWNSIRFFFILAVRFNLYHCIYLSSFEVRSERSKFWMVWLGRSIRCPFSMDILCF